MNDSDRRSPEDDPLACVEPTSAHRYFGVHLFRKDGRLGLRIDQQSGSLCVGDIKDGAPAAEWNHNCDLTFPDDKLEKGDLIIRVNGIGVGKSTNVDDNGRTKELDAMLDEFRDKQKEGYLLVVERKVTRFQCPDPLPAPPPAPTVITNTVPPPPPPPPPPPSAIQSAPVPVESFPQTAILDDESGCEWGDELPGRWRNHGRNEGRTASSSIPAIIVKGGVEYCKW